MRTWSYGGNGYKKFLSGHVEIIEQPLWLSIVEWWADHGCSFIPPIPLPKWPLIRWDEKNKCSMRDWYGDLQGVYCVHVCNKLFPWVWNHPKRKSYTFEVGWEKLKEVMYTHDKKWFDDWNKVNEMD